MFWVSVFSSAKVKEWINLIELEGGLDEMLYVKMIYRLYVHAKSLQSCPTLCDAMDCSLPGSSVYGILQARMLEWVVMPSSRGSSQPRDQTHIS